MGEFNGSWELFRAFELGFMRPLIRLFLSLRLMPRITNKAWEMAYFWWNNPPPPPLPPLSEEEHLKDVRLAFWGVYNILKHKKEYSHRKLELFVLSNKGS